jgi:hypothetical protein
MKSWLTWAYNLISNNCGCVRPLQLYECIGWYKHDWDSHRLQRLNVWSGFLWCRLSWKRILCLRILEILLFKMFWHQMIILGGLTAKFRPSLTILLNQFLHLLAKCKHKELFSARVNPSTGRSSHPLSQSNGHLGWYV